MALGKVHSAVDAEVSRVMARGRDGIASSGRAPRLTFEGPAMNSSPQFLQIDRIDWPPAVMELLATVQSHSQMGYFPEMQRTWVSVDNKLLLWNYATGRDMCIFGGFSKLIVAVGEPAKPKPGVFRDCISRVIAIASCDVVALIGVQQRVEGGSCETRLVDLEFTTAAPCMIVKFATCPHTGAIFAAGADGQVYQVHYERTSSVLYPRMSMMAASSNGLVRSSLNFIVSTLKTSLGSPAPSPLVDICYDSRNQLIFTLNAANTIMAYERHGVNLTQTLKFTYDAAKRTTGVAGGSPIVAIHIGAAPNTIVAVTEAGERMAYKVSIDTWTSASSLQEAGEAFPTPLPPQHLLSRSWYAEGLFVTSSVDALQPKLPDAVAFVSDGVLGEPSVGFRVVTSPSECMRVECVCEVEAPAAYADAIQQIIGAPRQIIVMHRRGISVFMRLRPIDALQLILESPKEERDRKLTQFSSRCSSAEFCVMLTQLASRSAYALGGNTSEGLIARRPANGAADTSRVAADILRRYSQPSVEEKLRGSVRDITVNYSAFVIGATTYLSRLLIPVWAVSPLLLGEQGLTAANLQKLKATEEATRRFIAFLEQTHGDLWAEPSQSSSNVPQRDVAWEKTTARLEVPQTALFVLNAEAKTIQSTYIHALLQFARSVSQVLTFFLVCGRFEKRVIEQFAKELAVSKEYGTDVKSTIGKFVTSSGDAKKVARFIAKTVVQSSSACPKEVTLLFEEMERDSPFLFDAADREEYETILQFTDMMNRSNVSEAGIQQVLSRTAGIAGALYRSGALMPLVDRLKQMNMQREAISLCLFAAAQLDGADEWEKLTIYTTAMLERLYEYDRHTFNVVVGTPQTAGNMWYVRPQDTRTHVRLLSWLAERRCDEALTHVLQSTLVRVPSSELESFLCRNIHELGLVYAEYLSRVRGDARAAVEVCSRLLQDPLLHIHASDRLAYRLQCARKAVECALDANATQRIGAEHAMETLLLQTKLMSVIQRFLGSGSRALDDLIADNSGRTQRDLALQHLSLIQSEMVSQEKIFVLALNYEVMDEAVEIAMEALCLNRTYDAVVVSRLLQRAITAEKSLSDISKFVQRFGKRPGFPLVSLILLAEQFQYPRFPNGSGAVPKMLVESGIELDTIFQAYGDVIERRAVQLETALGIEGRIPDSYMLYSQATLLHRADGRVGGPMRFVAVVRQSLDRLARTSPQSEGNVLKAIGELVDSL